MLPEVAFTHSRMPLRLQELANLRVMEFPLFTHPSPGQGTHVATGSMDNTAKLWDVASRENFWCFFGGACGVGWCVFG